MYNTLEQLAAAAADRPMHEVVIADEAALTDASRKRFSRPCARGGA